MTWVADGGTIVLGGKVRTFADNLPVTSGTIYAVVQLRLPGDSDDGKYWDTNAGGSWQTSPTTWPTATYRKSDFWDYLVPTGATTGKKGGEIKLVALTDNVATPASATTIDGRLEQVTVSNTWEYSPSGISQVTLTIDDGTNPVEGVRVNVYDSGNTTLLRGGLTTDVAGQVVFAIDDGTYKVRLALSGYSFTVPETLTVSGTTTDTYSGTSLISIPSPSAPDLCVIFARSLRDAGGNVIASQAVTATAIVEPPQAVDPDQLGNTAVSTTTDVNGNFDLELIRTSKVRFVIVAAGINAVYSVPDAAQQDVIDWVPVA
jgi:hypothetical protein